MKKAVVWTIEEKEKLREEYMRLRPHGGSQEDCLFTAMILLPEHRRKNVKNCTSKLLKQIGLGPENQRPASRKVVKKVVKPKSVPKPTRTAVPQLAPTPRVPGPIGIATENFISDIAKEVAGVIGLQVLDSVRRNVDDALYGMFDRLVQKVTGAVLKEVQHAVKLALIELPQQQPHQPSSITLTTSQSVDPAVTGLTIAPRDRKPRVTVIGLMSQQQQEIRKEFEEVADLAFTQSTSPNVLSVLEGRDIAFIMIKFSRHSAEEDCRRKSVPFVRVTGGVSHLRGEIRKWVNGEIAIAEVAR